MYNWPLNTNNFSFWERLKIASFIMNPKNIWTQGEVVSKFEGEMAKFVGCKYAVFCSSGSTANTILAMYLRKKAHYSRNKVIFPSTTWTTSVSPFVINGFKPVFVDIDLKDLSANLEEIDSYLKYHNDVALVFITSLLGIIPNINKINELRKKYPKTEFWMDNCENTFGRYKGKNINGLGINCTTSTYFGHQIQSVEGGFIFTDESELHGFSLMARNHGMVRSLPDGYKIFFQNTNVDSRFDFNILGNNFRNTNIHALVGLLDFGKRYKNIEWRKELYHEFLSHKKAEEWLTFPDSEATNVMFSLPLINKNNNPKRIIQAKELCDSLKIETRPIISGNLLRQTCYSKYKNREYPNSDHVHYNGFYVGLHSGVSKKQLKEFLTAL